MKQMQMEPVFSEDISFQDVTRIVDFRCPSCGADQMAVFYVTSNVPVHSVLLFPNQDLALNYPKGDIELGLCQECGFISNTVFDPAKLEYSQQYEETQSFSPTFRDFHDRLARDLIERYNLRSKKIIEIGCGKGEFLTLLCEMGDNIGVGFDPAYVSGRTSPKNEHQTTFIADFYSEKYSDYYGDFYCCKMTLEHIHQTADFLFTIRRAVGDRPETRVFFQVPDTLRVFQELAFWDIYYEHCSYFTPGSLARLFQSCGFKVIDLWQDYDDQYLMITAVPDVISREKIPQDEAQALIETIVHFTYVQGQRIQMWKDNLQEHYRMGRRVVVWGAGSKAVAFLTALGVKDEIEYVIDINPYKHGTFLAGTGHKIVSPQFLQEYQPDIVIVMNPIYQDEIHRDLEQMGVKPVLQVLSG
jgi:SAM-dependent methyltransferase